MTDQQTYTTTWGDALLSLSRSIPTYGDGNLAVKLPPIMSESVVIPTFELLTMIDRLDPDVMRAYLRENTEGWCDCGGQTTAREVPEADSPEDGDALDPVAEMCRRVAREAWTEVLEAIRAGALDVKR